jgi:Altronate dehydratase
MSRVLKINESDNVVVALEAISTDSIISVDGVDIKVLQDVPRGHKIAIKPLSVNEDIMKYGFAIGHATADIVVGEHIHTQNTKTNLSGVLSYNYEPKFTENPYPNRNLTFKGYRRANGNVGIRNDLFIVPTVGCVNGMAEIVKAEVLAKYGADFPFEDIQVLKHQYGCSQLGDDHRYTMEVLGDAVLHPNAGGVLIMGLGCENNIISIFEESLGEYDKTRTKILSIQSVQDEIAASVALIAEIVETTRGDLREDIPLSELRVGLKCGGSDGFSGITANPLLGHFSDFLVAQGGTTVLTEVPEMFGAEEILMSRAKDAATFDKIVHLINDFKEYFLRYNQPVYENPSPGNKAGGITTLEDKSLGCTQKAGTSPVVDVLKYAERLKNKGLNLLSAPGNDLVAASALASSGCHIVLFTTGRGTPFGSYVPTMKISTNTALYETKPHWIDFNAGQLVDGRPMEELVEDFIQYIIKVASGELVNNEKNKFSELAIFKDGVTL